jgi:similar to spore coat protein
LDTTISLRETLDLHELIMFKVLCATKSSTMNALVQDEELKNIMQMDVATTKEQLQELKNLIANSDLSEVDNSL